VFQLAEHSWSHFCYSPVIIRGSAGKAQLVTLLFLSTHHPWISWQSTAGHISVTLQSSPVDQLAKHSWSHFCYYPLITRGSAGKIELVTLLSLYTHHPCISWQSTAGHTSVTLQSSPVDQLAKHSWSHFCYSPLITRGSAGRAQLVTFLLLPTHNTWSAGRLLLVTLRLLFTHHPWISWQSTAGHTSVTLHSSPVDQLAEHSWSHFCYSPLITRGSAGRVELVTLLSLYTHHPCISWQSTAGHTSDTLHSSPVSKLAEYSWSQFCYSTIITRGSAGKAQLITLLLLYTHHRWICWQSTAGQNSITLHSSTVDQLAEHSWSHCCYSTVFTRVSAGRAHWSHFSYSPLNTRVSAGREQMVTLLLLSIHHPWIRRQSIAGHTSVILHSSPVDQLADHSWSHFCYSPLITRGSAGRVQLVTVLLFSTHHTWISWQSTVGHTSVTLHL
jgi:hypothetical protein